MCINRNKDICVSHIATSGQLAIVRDIYEAGVYIGVPARNQM